MFSFLKSFVGVKGQQLGQELVQAIVSIDPNAATQAQLDQMEKDLDAAGTVLQKIRTDYDREVREADAAEKRYHQLLAAAEHLQAKVATAGPSEQGSLEASLQKLVEQLERFVPELEQERQDVVDVRVLLDEAQAAYKLKAEALGQAKQNLERAKRDMQRAVIQQERAEEQSRRAAEVAGLRQSSGNKLHVAIEAMQRKTDEARAQAASHKMKADALSTMAAPEQGDANIVAALKAVESGARSGSLTDRLAALKGTKPLALPPS